MTYLTRDQVVEAEDREFAEVDCPEWGGVLRLASISGRQRDEYEQSMVDQRGSDRKLNMRDARAKLIVLCAVDGEGRRLFTTRDLQVLTAKNAKPIDRVFTVAQQLCGLTDRDMDKLTENFDEDPDDGFTSD